VVWRAHRQHPCSFAVYRVFRDECPARLGTVGHIAGHAYVHDPQELHWDIHGPRISASPAAKVPRFAHHHRAGCGTCFICRLRNAQPPSAEMEPPRGLHQRSAGPRSRQPPPSEVAARGSFSTIEPQQRSNAASATVELDRVTRSGLPASAPSHSRSPESPRRRTRWSVWGGSLRRSPRSRRGVEPPTGPGAR